jgi:hypothetical protein
MDGSVETSTPTDWLTWIRDEQAALWHDLDEAIRSAINGRWSMAAANVARRAVGAARLVGPTPIDSVPWVLVAGGVYEAVLLAGGTTPAMPDDAEWERLDEVMRDHGGTRAQINDRMAGTVAAINTDRERNWIAQGTE